MSEPTGTVPASGEDATAADLTPRPARRGRSRRRRWISALVVVGVAAAIVVSVVNLLGDASLFFYNADEAVARRDELADQRFRIQGTPVEGTVVETFRGDEPVVAFTIAFDDVAVDVVHVGDPPELFQPDVPVVLEGHWVHSDPPVDDFAGLENDGWYFASDRMLVKHDNDYRNRDDYDERISEAERGGRPEMAP